MNYLIGDIGNTNIKICKLNKKFKSISLLECSDKMINNYEILTNLKKNYELSNWRYWKYKYKNL